MPMGRSEGRDTLSAWGDTDLTVLAFSPCSPQPPDVFRGGFKAPAASSAPTAALGQSSTAGNQSGKYQSCSFTKGQVPLQYTGLD